MGGATTVPHCNIIFVLRSYVNVTLQPVLSWLFSSKAGTLLGGHGFLYIVRTFIETTVHRPPLDSVITVMFVVLDWTSLMLFDWLVPFH